MSESIKRNDVIEESEIGNVKSLRLFFQNNKLPIMGMPQLNNSNSSLNHCDSNQNGHKIPRPPASSMSCSTVNVEGYIKVLPNEDEQSGHNEIPVPKPRKSIKKTEQTNQIMDSKSDGDSSHCSSHNPVEFVSKKLQTIHLSNDAVTSNSTSNSTSNKKTKKHKSLSVIKNKIIKLAKNSENKSKNKSKSNDSIEYIPRKPLRSPPPRPQLVFKPLPELPDSDDDYGDIINLDDNHEEIEEEPEEIEEEIEEEIYNDDIEEEHEEGIYDRLENDVESDETDYYEGVKDSHSHSKEFEDEYYQDASEINGNEAIYEVLPFEYEQNYGSLESCLNSIKDDSNGNYNKFDKKRKSQNTKLMKKFQLTGQEVPINSGVVKDDFRGGRNELSVKKGETVLIIRMEGNPPGKWIAKNEKGKIGYIELSNITFDPESVKSSFKHLLPFNNVK